jgi:hypothetical protein
VKLPDFTTADRTARVALAAGTPVPSGTAAALGLRMWWTMPRCHRSTRAGSRRPSMVRQYLAELRSAGGAR